MPAAKVKLAVSMSPTLVDRVQREVRRGKAKSVSAYLERAVAGQLAAETELDAMLAEALAAGGPPTAEERAQARRVLRGRAG